VAAPTRVGDEGGGVWLGWPQLGRCHGPAQRNSNILFYSNSFLTIFSKVGLPELKKIQSKYGIVKNKTRNNFPYCNFSKFGLEFELKITKGSRC
jgi:hypothetical protein